MNNKKTSKIKLLKVLGKLLLPFIVLFFPILVIAFLISPKFFSRLVRLVFERQFKIPPKEFIYTDSVKSISNLQYGADTTELMDLHLPSNPKGPCPLILWAHGGAYVAGDKNYLLFFARVLAHYGYAVATFDYSLAPEAHYPVPLLQVGKAYTFLTSSNYENMKFVDTTKLFLAGDSAGAQIVAQFALLQTNQQYLSDFKKIHTEAVLPPVISLDVLRGLLLYCGPFSLKEIQTSPKKSLKFLFWQTAWAYFGKRRVSRLDALDEVDIVPHITADFPPSFIADGNTFTFPKHGRDLAAALDRLGVANIALIFDDYEKKVYHEFELDLATREARQALLTALAFLKKYR